MSKEYTLHLLQQKYIGEQWKDTPEGNWDFLDPLKLSIDTLEFQKNWCKAPNPDKISKMLEFDVYHHGHKYRDLRWVEVKIQVA